MATVRRKYGGNTKTLKVAKDNYGRAGQKKQLKDYKYDLQGKLLSDRLGVSSAATSGRKSSFNLVAKNPAPKRAITAKNVGVKKRKITSGKNRRRK